MTLNVDNAGDKALLIKLVADELVEQLRGFGADARLEIANQDAEEYDDEPGGDPRRWADDAHLVRSNGY